MTSFYVGQRVVPSTVALAGGRDFGIGVIESIEGDVIWTRWAGIECGFSREETAADLQPSSVEIEEAYHLAHIIEDAKAWGEEPPTELDEWDRVMIAAGFAQEAEARDRHIATTLTALSNMDAADSAKRLSEYDEARLIDKL